MHQLNPDKLYQSKWTAAAPKDGEKHFIVIDVIRDADEHVQDVVLQAVLTRRSQTLAWRELTDNTRWLIGWQ